MGRLAFVLIIGLGGAGILVALGVWQVNRLAEKNAFIAEIDATIAAAPVALPDAPNPERDNYLPVAVSGTYGAQFIRVLVSQKQVGAGYRIISPMDTGAGRVMVDRGFVSTDFNPNDAGLQAEGVQTVVGNLQWPRESDGFTPTPDQDNNIWFARDVDQMAQALGTDPILVVQRDVSQPGGPATPLPVDTSAIPNDHLQYAITWFSLAAVWLGMTIAFLRRARPSEQS